MSLFNRHKAVSLGKAEALEPTVRRFILNEDDPFSSKFNSKCGNTPKDIVNFLIAVQVRKFGNSIISDGKFKPVQLQKNAKDVLKKYKCTPDTLKRAIQVAADRSPYPFTFKMVANYLKEVEERCQF